MIGGRWTNKDEVVHINKTERLAIFFGINFFSRNSVQNIYVLKLTIPQLFHLSMQWVVRNQSNHIN